MKSILIFFLVLSSFFNSIGQSVSLPDIIKISKLDSESLDTYLTSKGFGFVGSKKNDDVDGLEYAYDYKNNEANKFITVYNRFFDTKFCVNFQTLDRQEYLKIKNQIKVLGFELYSSKVVDGSKQMFRYRKGKNEISVFSNIDLFEINFIENY
jgi:hypothetical protein